jgi:hypothetical protein
MPPDLAGKLPVTVRFAETRRVYGGRSSFSLADVLGAEGAPRRNGRDRRMNR